MSERTVEQLVQYDKLKSTNQITNPEDIPLGLLKMWWKKAWSICSSDSFSAIAFNQFPEDTLKDLGLTPEKACIIYIHNDLQEGNGFPGHLLINPEIQIQQSTSQTISFEGCGSILTKEGERPSMFVTRPPTVLGAACIWKPGQIKPIYREFSSSQATSLFIQHEHVHLNGKTALSYPDVFFDFRQEYVWKHLSDCFSSLFGKGVLERLVAIEKRFIIYDEAEGHFVLVDNKGRTIKERF